MKEDFATGCNILPPRLRQWRWPTLPPYNGFTHEERVLGWQLIHVMVDSGSMSKPQKCSISGSTQRLQYHCEDYYAPWSAYSVTQPLHMALHRRFKQPKTWERIVSEYGDTGHEWFCALAIEPVDLAGTLRNEHGDEIVDVFRNFCMPHRSVKSRLRALSNAQ